MQYMLLMYFEENSLTEKQKTDCYEESAQFAHKLAEKGQYVSAAPLHHTSTATSLRPQDGKRLVTDGPFAETREQLGGFFIIQVDNLDQAIEIASQVPGGRFGTVEIRPLIDVPSLPQK